LGFLDFIGGESPEGDLPAGDRTDIARMVAGEGSTFVDDDRLPWTVSFGDVGDMAGGMPLRPNALDGATARRQRYVDAAQQRRADMPTNQGR